jgi:hypothetical protein
MEIVTAKTIAKKDNCRNAFEWMQKAAIRRGIKLTNTMGESAVVARIDHGRWIADCECNGAEYVDPDEPIFYCLSCLNIEYGGALRPVRFPPLEIREKIISGLKSENFNSWNEKEEPYGI